MMALLCIMGLKLKFRTTFPRGAMHPLPIAVE